MLSQMLAYCTQFVVCLFASRNDSAALGALSKALAGKLGSGEAVQDVLAAVWGFAHLHVKPDAGLLNKAAGVIKGGTSDLSNEQKIYAAWSFALLGQVMVCLRLFLSVAKDCWVLPLIASVEQGRRTDQGSNFRAQQ